MIPIIIGGVVVGGLILLLSESARNTIAELRKTPAQKEQDIQVKDQEIQQKDIDLQNQKGHQIGWKTLSQRGVLGTIFATIFGNKPTENPDYAEPAPIQEGETHTTPEVFYANSIMPAAKFQLYGKKAGRFTPDG